MLIKYLLIVFCILGILYISPKFNKLIFRRFPYFKYILFFGIFIHEMSHALMALLTGARVRSIHFEMYKGYVEHTPSKIPILGNILISLAPTIIGTMFIYLILYYLVGIDATHIISITNNNLSLHYEELYQFQKLLSLKQWETWLAIFLLLNIAITYIPSKQDFINIYESMAAYSLIVIIITLLEKKIPDIYSGFNILHSHLLLIFIMSLSIICIAYLISLIADWIYRISSKF